MEELATGDGGARTDCERQSYWLGGGDFDGELWLPGWDAAAGGEKGSGLGLEAWARVYTQLGLGLGAWAQSDTGI